MQRAKWQKGLVQSLLKSAEQFLVDAVDVMWGGEHVGIKCNWSLKSLKVNLLLSCEMKLFEQGSPCFREVVLKAVD